MAEVLEAGARVGVYEIVDRLGTGGMGVVYRARDTRLGRTVALKVLRAEDPELLRRLETEARAASALNHPNIVHIYDVGVAAREAGAHYVAMEYVDGATLRRRLGPGPLGVPELLDLGAQLADGLAKAHRAGIVHRDLKPENVMVTPDGLVKILDFGLAKVVRPLGDLEAQETLTRQGTRAGTLLGTLEYMSPEQASGRPVDFRTDQFAVGLILSEMATARPVFRRDTPAQVLAAVIERDPAPLRQQRPDVPPALEAIVTRCLQKDPAQRWASTDELASGLAALAGRSRSGSLAASVPVSAELLPAPASAPARTSVYHVQAGFGLPGRRHGRHGRGDGGVQECDEHELARLIRRGKLTGAELVRRDDEEAWRPLFESSVFRREVPSVGDPRDAARWRVLRALGGHFTGFFIVGVVMYSTQGHLPFWMGIWGAVLAVQTLRAVPAVRSLLGRRPLERGPGEARPVAAGALPQLPPPGGVAGVPSGVAQEAARVRELIAQRGGSDASRLLTEVDGIVKRTVELASRQADLEEQTTDAERKAIASAVAEARSRLESVTLAQDRRLFERQLEVLQRREETIAKAVRVLERLRVRRTLAEHQLKQLRLDLSRDAAMGLDVPELSSRLERIRHEVDAREEVEEIDAATD
ncbi:MAG: serine/threonine-protein kinase [Betaproteobacteria bacterium]